MMSIFRYILLIRLILVVNCSSNVPDGLVNQIRDETGAATNSAMLMHQLSDPVQQTYSNPNRNPHQNPNNGNIESNTKRSGVNIGRSLLEELLRSGEVKRKSSSNEIEQCNLCEKTPDQRYHELLTAFNVILEEISHQKKESKVAIDIPDVLNQMAPQTMAIFKKQPFDQIQSKTSDSKSFLPDKVLDQSQSYLLRSIEKLDSQVQQFIDKLKQTDDYESGMNDDNLTYNEEDIEPMIITQNDYDYISDEPHPIVSGQNDIRRLKRSRKNSSESKPLHGHEMVTEL